MKNSHETFAQREMKILERILDGGSMPPFAEGTNDQAFVDFTRYLEGGGPWDERYNKFLPQERKVSQ